MGFWDGTATDWGTSVGTVGLALISTVSVIREGRERKELKDERDVARRRTEELEQQNTERAEREAAVAVRMERRRLADGVSCQMGLMPRDPVLVSTASGTAPTNGQGPVECAIIQNVSDRPIRQIEVRWLDVKQADHAIAPSIVFGGLLDVVPAFGRHGVVKPDAISGYYSSQVALLVLFTDANDLRWARGNDGRLYAVSETGAVGPQER